MSARTEGPAAAVAPVGGRAARWYEDAVIYELHVRAFADSNGDGVGDFRGLIPRLDHVRDLGADTVWLLPFYPSPLRDDGYDIAAYKAVHPMYGTLGDFRAFMREAKRRGLRVITELVLNHTSDEHRWFQRARRARPGSAHRNFYVWSDTPDRYPEARVIFQDFESSNWTWDPVAGQYYWHRFYAHQPDLNFDEPRVRAAMLDVVDFWLGLGVDGLRLDAVPYLFERDGTNCENLPETLAFLSDLRRHVDERFDDRVLLAEANQWPADAVAYFGDGDRCHMAFHFPLMPRMFMATRMEDRFPIVDILQQSPPIPHGARWATFLRNHDELTLEMVTDEERDYMYRVYADDPQARLNLGIRRRLAPLLGNDRRRIEMMNVLLFSLPGTPVVYYGDEIGMGDNIYLGDRNGVRTPMQWNTDRNAGFSSANPQRLYLPVIADPEYQPGAVNVEAQHTNAHSLLWWMRHLIAVRRGSPAFATGDLEFVFPENRKVLVFLRTSGEERVLVVVNLSRAAQFVELDLSRFAGMVPVEMFGPTEFPRIGELPYFVTLGPYGYYWFRLEAPPGEEARESAPPTVRVDRSWRDAFAPGGFQRIATGAGPYLRSQRWFGHKGARVVGVRAVSTIPVDAAGVLGLVEVRTSEGDPQVYAMPVVARDPEAPAPPEYAVIAELEAADGRRLLTDGLWDEGFAGALLGLVAGRRVARGDGGRLVATRTGAFAALRGDPGEPLEPRIAGSEQSNTSLVFGDRLIMKVFRRPGRGTNPDLELSSFLTTRAGFEHTPRLAGAIEFVPSQGERRTVAMVQAYVPNEGDAWSLTLDALRASFEDALAAPVEPETDAGAPGDGAAPVPPDADVLGPHAELVRLLGERTAGMHAALASDPDDPPFAPEPFSRLYQRSLQQALASQVGRTFRRLRTVGDPSPELAALLEREREVTALVARLLEEPIAGVRLRHHGDYHLGQVLWTGRDVTIIDFEGEPARPLSERRIKRTPLRDVAGMLRSFDYAADTALRSPSVAALAEHAVERLEPWARRWTRLASSTFLAAYLEAARSAIVRFLPADDGETDRLLRAMVLEKATYELGYELDHRPEWLGTPVRGLAQILDEAAAT